MTLEVSDRIQGSSFKASCKQKADYLAVDRPFSLIISVLSYLAGAHAVAKQEFSAGYRIGEWWPIFRKNIGGFVLAMGVAYVIAIAFTLVMQILYITLILACLLPFLMPAYVFYMILVTEPMIAQAYREGRDKFTAQAVVSSQG